MMNHKDTKDTKRSRENPERHERRLSPGAVTDAGPGSILFVVLCALCVFVVDVQGSML
jgi:hypothetical protein